MHFDIKKTIYMKNTFVYVGLFSFADHGFE